MLSACSQPGGVGIFLLVCATHNLRRAVWLSLLAPPLLHHSEALTQVV